MVPPVGETVGVNIPKTGKYLGPDNNGKHKVKLNSGPGAPHKVLASQIIGFGEEEAEEDFVASPWWRRITFGSIIVAFIGGIVHQFGTVIAHWVISLF